MGQDDIFGALEVELGHIDLIRNISLMQWNLEVQPTSNYSLGMAPQVYLELGHANLLGDLAVKSLEIGYTDLFGFLRICSLVWTQKVLQAMGIVFPCQPLLQRVRLEIYIIYRAWRIKL